MKTKRACSLAKRSASGGERTTLNVTSFMLFSFFLPPPPLLLHSLFSSIGENPKGREKKVAWDSGTVWFYFLFSFPGNSFQIESEDIQFGADLSSIFPPPFLIIFKTYWFLFLARLGNQQSYFLKGHCRHLFREFWFGDSVVASWWRACFISRKRKTENKWVRCIKGSSRRNEIGIEISDGQKIKNKREQTRNV